LVVVALGFECDALHVRWRSLLAQHDATSKDLAKDYFKPHVTLSYDALALVRLTAAAAAAADADADAACCD